MTQQYSVFAPSRRVTVLAEALQFLGKADWEKNNRPIGKSLLTCLSLSLKTSGTFKWCFKRQYCLWQAAIFFTNIFQHNLIYFNNHAEVSCLHLQRHVDGLKFKNIALPVDEIQKLKETYIVEPFLPYQIYEPWPRCLPILRIHLPYKARLHLVFAMNLEVSWELTAHDKMHVGLISRLVGVFRK